MLIDLLKIICGNVIFIMSWIISVLIILIIIGFIIFINFCKNGDLFLFDISFIEKNIVKNGIRINVK